MNGLGGFETTPAGNRASAIYTWPLNPFFAVMEKTTGALTLP
jgi:hypothetical protein